MKEQQKEGFLTGRKVVVLGGSAGIGLAVAQAAVAEGAAVVIASSNQARVNVALETLPADSIGYAVDLLNEQSIKALFEKIGPFDHLVFTAGEPIQLVRINDAVIEDVRNFFNLRYWGAFTAIKYASQHIDPKGSIVLTGGVAGERPGAGWSLGASICMAMEGFTRAMAVELAPVRVNLVSPGVVKTDLWGNMSESERNSFYTQIGDTLPVKRVGEAKDIAQAYIYFMRQEFGTGQTIVADGGAVLV